MILNLRKEGNTQWELLYSRQSTTAELSSTAALLPFVGVDIDVLQIGGTYQRTSKTVRPYVAVTLGGTRIRAASESDNFFSGSIGVGAQFMPESRIGIRVEARAYATLTDSDTDLLCRTGPDQNICAVRIDGDLLSQVEIFAGLVFRF